MKPILPLWDWNAHLLSVKYKSHMLICWENKSRMFGFRLKNPHNTVYNWIFESSFQGLFHSCRVVIFLNICIFKSGESIFLKSSMLCSMFHIQVPLNAHSSPSFLHLFISGINLSKDIWNKDEFSKFWLNRLSGLLSAFVLFFPLV